MRILLPLTALFLLAPLAAAPAQQAGMVPGAVAGHVFCSDSQTPCRFAAVTIESAPAKNKSSDSAESARHTYSGFTDIDGAFQIAGVAPGDYYVLPRLAGYLSPFDIAANEYRSSSSKKEKIPWEILDASLTRISVASGQTTTAALSLARGGSIEGTVLYDDGAPGINLQVHLYRKEADGSWKEYFNFSGDSPFAPLGMGFSTDSRGHYSKSSLPPGLYKVEANLPVANMAMTGITGRPSLNVVISNGSALQVFNGGKFRLREAPAIQLQEGEDRPGVDLTIPTDGLRTVAGLVTAKLNQEPIARGQVRLLDPVDKSMLRETELKSDGSFTFPYVTDGSYLLQIEPGGSYAPLTAPLLITGDLTDLSYSLAGSGGR